MCLMAKTFLVRTNKCGNRSMWLTKQDWYRKNGGAPRTTKTHYYDAQERALRYSKNKKISETMGSHPILRVELPNGQVNLEFYRSLCYIKKHSHISGCVVDRLANGQSWVIQHRKTTTKHPYPIGTKITLASKIKKD